MEYLIEICLFAGKTLFIVIGVGAVVSLIASLSIKSRPHRNIEVEDLNKKYRRFARTIKAYLLNKKALKKEKKSESKDEKKAKTAENKPTIFVLEFIGDMKASGTADLAEEITAILAVAQPGDEVMAIVESPGGVVHGYGLAAAQLLRIKEGGLKLTVAVDKVAASGGYMMACTADKIIAAPFAILGSVGVIAQVPNFNRLLKKHDIDYQEMTAGEYKRTVSIFGEITEKGKQKFVEQLEETHVLFKGFVAQYRAQVDIDKVATGEYWYGKNALELKLVDELQTSDQYLFSQRDTHKLYKIKYPRKKSFMDKFSESASSGVALAIEKIANYRSY